MSGRPADARPAQGSGPAQLAPNLVGWTIMGGIREPRAMPERVTASRLWIWRLR